MTSPPLHAIATAVAFFSRLPVPAGLQTAGLAQAAAMAPVAGLVVALPAAVLMVLGAQLTGPLAGAVIGTVALIVLTGALHEDGLADCADGFWGGATPERRLAIMRDSRIGTYGVLALVGAVLLKVALLEALLSAGSWGAAAAFLAAAVAGRAVALYPWVGLLPARADGLAVAVGRPTVPTFRRALVIAIVATALLLAWWAPVGWIVASLGAAGAAKGCASLADRKIGGHTGDVIGATVVLCDLTYLLAVTIWIG